MSTGANEGAAPMPLGDMMEQAAAPKATESDLKRVAEMAKQVKDKSAKVAELESKLKAAKEELRKIAEVRLPEFMRDELGLRSVELADGGSVVITPKISASIKKDDMAKAHKWLIKNGHGDLIKLSLSVAEPREKAPLVEAAVGALRALYGIEAKTKEAVHPQTLLAFVKEQLEKGVELPDSISTHEYFIAEIKLK